jgi:hypothetical protein
VALPLSLAASPAPPMLPSSQAGAPANVAPNAKIAARPRRWVGNTGAAAARNSSGSGCEQNGQLGSLVRTWREQAGHLRRWVFMQFSL